MRRIRLIVSLVALAGSACTGGSAAKPTTSSAASVPGSVVTTANTVPITTTLAPVPVVPAGMQFSGTPTVITPGAGDHLSVSADGSRWFGVGGTPSTTPICPGGGSSCNQFANNPVFFAGPSPDALLPTTIDEISTLPAPSGFPLARTFAPAGPLAGFVAVGSIAFWDSNLFRNATSRAVAWHSPDGVSWQRIDLGPVIGDRLSDLSSVIATPTGFLAVGGVGDGSETEKSGQRGLVLTSADGVTWVNSAELASTWAVNLKSAFTLGDRLVVAGVTYVCDATAGVMITFSVGGQSVLWSSSDNGATWSPIDLAAAGVAAGRPVAPTDASGCGNLEANDKLRWDLATVSVAEKTLLLVSSDGAKTATTKDLSAWINADIPNAVPKQRYPDETLTVGQHLAYGDAEGLKLLSVEPRRNAEGKRSLPGTSVLGWTSSDGGASWVQAAETRPLKTKQAGRLRRFDNGSVAMALVPARDDLAAAQQNSLVFSTAGSLVSWGKCTFAAGADCAFVILDATANAKGLDLTGIDLSGAVASKSVFDGANLTGAMLDDGSFPETSFIGANLAGASITKASLRTADLSNANLAGATLSGSSLPTSVLTNASALKAVMTKVDISVKDSGAVKGIDLSGVELAKSSFSGPFEGLASFPGANFSGANLTGVTFSRIDLTGANFAGAKLDGVYFDKKVVCPDGTPANGGIGAAACRL